MKTWTIMLTAGLVLAALPLVTAETPCSRAGSTEAIGYPGEPERYLFLDLTQPSKVGEWIEKNKSPGLQTMPCFSASGALKWGKDTHVPVTA